MATGHWPALLGKKLKTKAKILIWLIVISLWFGVQFYGVYINHGSRAFGIFNLMFINYQDKVRLANRVIKSKSDFIKSEYKKLKTKYEQCFIVAQGNDFILIHLNYLSSESYLYYIKDEGMKKYSDFYNPEVEYIFEPNSYKIKLKNDEFLKHFNQIYVTFYEDDAQTDYRGDSRILFVKQGDEFLFDYAMNFDYKLYSDNKYKMKNRVCFCRSIENIK